MPLPQLERILRERGSSGSRLMGELGYARQLWSQNQTKGWPHPVAQRVAAHLGVPLATLTTAGPASPTRGSAVAALLNHVDVAAPYQALQSAIDAAVDRAVHDIAVAVAGLVSAGTVDGRQVAAQGRAVTEEQLARARELPHQAEPAQRRAKASR